MIDLAFTNEQREQLTNWLAAQQSLGVMGINELEGYLFALVAAPSPISEETWLQQALANNTHELAEDKLFALMALHNDVSERVYSDGYAVSKVINITQPAQDNLALGAPLQLWSQGFCRGAALFIENLLSEQQNPSYHDLYEAFSTTLAYLSFFANPQNDPTAADDVLTVLDGFAEGFASLVEALALATGQFTDDDWE